MDGVRLISRMNDVTRDLVTNREIIGGRCSKGMRLVTWLDLLETELVMGRNLGQEKKAGGQEVEN